jgi:hypothetical protein
MQMVKQEEKAKHFLRYLPCRRGKRSAKIITSLILVTLLFLPFLFPSVSFATIVQPDSPPTLSDFHVNRNLAATGDMLFYFRFKIPYATTPNMTADNAFIFRLMSVDRTTDYGYITPYPYGDNQGYNDGLTGLYFTASAGLTWGTAYKLRISENPGWFDLPVDFDITIPTTAYSSFTNQLDNQAELATNLYYMAQPLEGIFGVALFQTAGSRQVLTGEGETYFRGAISGLQAMAPSIFLVQQQPLDTASREWTTEQFDTYEHRFDGTWVGASENATAEQIGAPDSASAMGLVFMVPLCLFAIIFSSMKMRTALPGFVCVSVLLIMGVLMGWMPKAIFASTYQAAGIYTAYLIFYARG